MNKKIKLLVFIISIVVIAVVLLADKARAPFFEPPKNDVKPSAEFDKQKLSTDKADSIWVVVNKSRALQPNNYLPNDLVVPNVPLRVPGNESMRLRTEAAKALEQLFAEANQAGLKLMLASGFRSYDYQTNLYNGYVANIGQAEADKQSARPGHSEHQTGLAADIEPASRACELQQCFGDTPEGKWLAVNSYKHGFILRYLDGKTSVTGYEYEPWHFRYVGKELAAEMQQKNITTLEEFFNLPGGTSY